MKLTRWLTYSICLLAFAASAGGILIPGVYRDSEFYKTAWQANDMVTLALIPIILVCLHQASKAILRAYFAWLGLMLFMFYNYAFYLFGAVFNKFFLLYAMLFSLSLYALIIGLIRISGYKFNDSFRNPWSRKIIAAFLFTISLILGLVETSQCVSFIVSETKPEIPVLILALDLSIVVPTSLIAAFLLWRANPWGIVLGAMMLIKSFAYGLVLITGTTLITITGLHAPDPLMPFYGFVAAGGFVFSWLILKSIKTKSYTLIPTI